MQGHTLHMRLIALLCGVVLAAATILGVALALPAQDVHDPDMNYGYVYSGAKSSSVAFMKATQLTGSLLVFGSSELSTPASIIPEVPAAVFGSKDYGIQLSYVGEAYDQSLWQTIALGAYARSGIVGEGGETGNKVVIIVGPGWFEDGGMDSSTFQTRFSYTLYDNFCDNPSISDETKTYVRQRLLDYGVSETTLDAASGAAPQDVLDSLVFAAIDDLRLRRDLTGVRTLGVEEAAAAADSSTTAGGTSVPDFTALHDQAVTDAEASTTSNDWGVEDSFYTGRIAPILTSSEGTRSAETYSDTPEYDDLSCFLDVCSQNGIEPLVVISPVLGPYYDHIGITEKTRSACYSRIREICSSHGVSVADFSDREYEPYFLFDIVHFGWTGWVDVEQAIYDFAEEG